MSAHKRCSMECCHQVECCPRGLFEHIEHFQYLKRMGEIWDDVPSINLAQYCWHEFKSLIGLNRAKEGDDYDECA